MIAGATIALIVGPDDIGADDFELAPLGLTELKGIRTDKDS